MIWHTNDCNPYSLPAGRARRWLHPRPIEMTDTGTATIAVAYERGIVTVAVQGRLTSPVVDELMRQADAALRAHAAQRLLYDLRRARLATSTLDLIKRPRVADELGIPQGRRIALLCSVRTPEYDLLVTAAQTRGHVLQIFTDGALALDWLRSEGG